MKVVQFDTFGPAHQVARIVDFPEPEPCTAGEVLVEVEAFPINPVDLLTIAGNYATRPPLPAVPPVPLLVQAPSSQVSPPGHAASHSPQWSGSLAVTVHVPAQISCPGGQPPTPSVHSCPVGHARSHAPQWYALVPRSTQLEPQAASGSAQLCEQAPSEQYSPGSHTTLQSPQWLPSLVRSAQAAPQALRPPWHTHVPPKHP